MWSCGRRPRPKVCKLLSPELCFLDLLSCYPYKSHLSGATMACGRSLWMGLIWTSWAMTLGAVAVSRRKESPSDTGTKSRFEMLQTYSGHVEHVQVSPNFVRFFLKFWPSQIHEDCLYVSASCGGLWRWVHHRLVLRVHECTSGHIWDTSQQTAPYCTNTAPIDLSSLCSQEFEHVWAIILVLRGCHGLCGRGGGGGEILLQKSMD